VFRQPAIVPAAALVEGCPPDLPAWCFYRREQTTPRARLLAVGDVGFSAALARTGADHDPFAEVAPLLSRGDVVFANLETPLLSESAGGQPFAGHTPAAGVLSRAGFSLVHLANNHIYDFGPGGLASTLAACRAAGLVPLGAGDTPQAARGLVRTDANGLRIGWLGCGRTLVRQHETGPRFWEFHPDELMEAVRQARPHVDVLILSIHIGLMYLDYPDPDHKALAERLQAAGADLILMHHAHVLQGVQASPQGVICHNLGNFLLDWREGNVPPDVAIEQQTQGAVFLFELGGGGVCLAAALPTYLDTHFRVRWARGPRGQAILERLARISRDLAGDYRPLFARQRAARNTGLTLKVLAFHLRRGNWPFVWAQLRRTRPKHLGMLARWLIHGTDS